MEAAKLAAAITEDIPIPARSEMIAASILGGNSEGIISVVELVSTTTNNGILRVHTLISATSTTTPARLLITNSFDSLRNQKVPSG